LVVGATGVAVGRRWSLVAVTVGACLMILGTTLQLGIGVSTLAAAGLLLAAGIQRFASTSSAQTPSLDAVVAAPPFNR
jgi:xanthine/uracil/vitamin C permease (AzgA family)